MEYKKLGKSGLYIAPILVGCLNFGKKSWMEWVIEDQEEVMSILKRCYDVGLRTFDTADAYSFGHSELLLGKFLKKYDIPRENVVILSKCFFHVEKTVAERKASDKPWQFANREGLSRKYVMDAVNKSVERLGTYIDVLQIHRLDRSTPKEEIMSSLNDVVERGLSRYIGACTMKAEEFAQLQAIADKHGWHKFISMQNCYNLLYREEEREMIPFCNDNIFGEVGLLTWSPTAQGLLGRPLGQESAGQKTDYFVNISQFNSLTEADKAIINRVEEIANKRNQSMIVIAIAWIILKGCAPMIRISSTKRVDDILNALSVSLTKDEIEYLEAPYKPKAVASV